MTAVTLISSAVWSAMLMTTVTAPVPDGTRPDTLDEELSINSIPTHVREWMLDMSLEESKQFYRHYLGERRIELAREHGALLAAPAGGGFTTVELLRADAARTRVRVSEARLISGQSSPDPVAIPLPPHTRILSSVSGGQGTGAAHTLVARTRSGLPSMVAFYEKALALKGLRMTQRRSLQQSPNASEALSFVGADQHIDIVLTSDAGRTWIAALASGPAP